MRHAGVFGNLAIDILAIDGLQRTLEKILELQPKARKFRFLTLHRPVDDILGCDSATGFEALSDTIQRAGACHHKITFAEVQQSRVVEVDRVLEGEERTDSRIREEKFVNPPE